MAIIYDTAQKIKFSIKDFPSKCDQIRRKLQIRSHLLGKSLKENFIFCAVILSYQILNLKLNARNVARSYVALIKRRAKFWAT